MVGDGILEINHNKKIIEHCFKEEELSEQLLKRLKPNTTVLMIGKKSLNLKLQLHSFIKRIKEI
jgi:hypothetical protein